MKKKSTTLKTQVDIPTQKEEQDSQEPPRKPANKKKVAAIVFVALIVAGLGSGILYAQLRGNGDPEEPDATTTQQTTATPTVEVTPTPEIRKPRKSPMSVIYCSQDSETYEFTISNSQTKKINTECPSFINGGDSYQYAPDGSAYVRIVDENKLVTGTINNENRLKHPTEKEIYISSGGELRVLGWASNSGVILREAVTKPGTENNTYPTLEESFYMITLGDTQRRFFEGTGGTSPRSAMWAMTRTTIKLLAVGLQQMGAEKQLLLAQTIAP